MNEEQDHAKKSRKEDASMFEAQEEGQKRKAGEQDEDLEYEIPREKKNQIRYHGSYLNDFRCQGAINEGPHGCCSISL